MNTNRIGCSRLIVSQIGVRVLFQLLRLILTPKSINLSELTHEWEEAAKVPSESGVRRVVVRSGVVLGRDGGMVKQIYLPFILGLGGPIASGNQYMPWIHIKDITRMFIHAIENDKVNGVLNGVAPQVINLKNLSCSFGLILLFFLQIVTNKEFTAAFASAMWRPAKIPVPEFFLNIVFNKERSKVNMERRLSTIYE